MSSQKDKTQPIQFVYSNLYQFYRNQPVEASSEPEVIVISESQDQCTIDTNMAVTAESAPSILEASGSQLDAFKANMQELEELHSRLHVMLSELEDIFDLDSKKKRRKASE